MRAAAFTSLFALVLPFAAAPGGNASAASFDCAKAKTSREELICHDPKLSDLDSQLKRLYSDM
jgi:uncharacterized protein